MIHHNEKDKQLLRLVALNGMALHMLHETNLWLLPLIHVIANETSFMSFFAALSERLMAW